MCGPLYSLDIYTYIHTVIRHSYIILHTRKLIPNTIRPDIPKEIIFHTHVYSQAYIAFNVLLLLLLLLSRLFICAQNFLARRKTKKNTHTTHVHINAV